MNDYTFGNFLYELRTEKGLSQAELGEIMGVSNKAVSKWEMGASKPRSDMLLVLASFFGVTVEELLVGRRLSQPAERFLKPVQDDLFTEHAEGMIREYRKRLWPTHVCIVAFFFILIALIVFVGVTNHYGVADTDWAGAVGGSVVFLALLDFLLMWCFWISAKIKRRSIFAAFPEHTQEIKAMLKPKRRERFRLNKTERIVLIICFSVAICMQVTLFFRAYLSVTAMRMINFVELGAWGAALGCYLVCTVRNIRK